MCLSDFLCESLPKVCASLTILCVTLTNVCVGLIKVCDLSIKNKNQLLVIFYEIFIVIFIIYGYTVYLNKKNRRLMHHSIVRKMKWILRKKLYIVVGLKSNNLHSNTPPFRLR